MIRVIILAFLPFGAARALDLPPPETPDGVGPRTQHVAVDGSAVGTSLGDRSVDFNSTFAPFGDIHDNGVRFRLSGSASWYRFVINENPRTLGSGRTWEVGVLGGYQFSFQRVSIMAMVGPTLAESNDDDVRSERLGAKMVLSMYARPSDQTMAYGSASYSTSKSLQIQSKVGVRLLGDFYVGPEATFSWRNVAPFDDFGHVFADLGQMRIGAHISAVTVGPVQIGVGGGWAHQQELGSGYYASMNFYLAF